MPDSQLQSTLETAFRHALAYLDGLEAAPVAPTIDLARLRQRLARPLTERGMDAQQVINDLAADVKGGILGSAGGRFFAWVIGGSLPAALAADWLTSAWDQNTTLYACGPAAAVAEEVVGAWLKDLLALPLAASFALTSGCQLAHVTCLAAARHALLERAGWDVEEQGLAAAPSIRVLSGERHGSLDRAVRLLGIGQRNLVGLTVDAMGCLTPQALDAALRAEPDRPTIVYLQAGDINTGAYEPFEALVPIARRHGAWVHVDGAIGLWAAASPRHRHLLNGASNADSWATDGHKWLNVPFDCGYAFVADPDAHRAALSHRAAYLSHDSEARDPIDWTPEWSRRARGFPTYAALRHLGRNGLAALVERNSELAAALVTRLGKLPNVEVLSRPIINQGLVRFRDPAPGASEADHDTRTERVIAGVAASGEAFFSGTTWRGHRAMRVSVCNWQSSERDVERAVRACDMVLKS